MREIDTGACVTDYQLVADGAVAILCTHKQAAQNREDNADGNRSAEEKVV